MQLTQQGRHWCSPCLREPHRPQRGLTRQALVSWNPWQRWHCMSSFLGCIARGGAEAPNSWKGFLIGAGKASTAVRGIRESSDECLDHLASRGLIPVTLSASMRKSPSPVSFQLVPSLISRGILPTITEWYGVASSYLPSIAIAEICPTGERSHARPASVVGVIAKPVRMLWVLRIPPGTWFSSRQRIPWGPIFRPRSRGRQDAQRGHLSGQPQLAVQQGASTPSRAPSHELDLTSGCSTSRARTPADPGARPPPTGRGNGPRSLGLG